jgi:hypothetical protein
VYPNPAVVQALAKDRVIELRQAAKAGATNRHEVRQPRVIEAARHGAGWLLVDVGLRLALPHGAVKSWRAQIRP